LQRFTALSTPGCNCAATALLGSGFSWSVTSSSFDFAETTPVRRPDSSE
jgi:hypothetical protein